MNIKLVCPYREISGYGKISRTYYQSLLHTGYNIEIDDSFFKSIDERITLPKNNKKLKSIDKTLYVIPPDRIPHVDKSYPIKLTMFETNLFPPHWVSELNQNYREVIVPCQYNVDGLKNSGYIGKISKVHCPIDSTDFDKNKEKLNLNITGEPYIFYSILHWQPRKDYESLLISYFAEFTEKDNVLLILKTNHSGNAAFQTINEIKSKLALNYYPPVMIIPQHLTDDEIVSLHNSCDCFVSAHHAEGFGMGMAEAMLAKNSVVCTNYSGNTEFCNDKTAYLVDYKEDIVYGMAQLAPDWALNFRGYMRWAQIDRLDLCRKMRIAYNQNKENYEGYNFVKQNFSYESIGKQLKDIL